MQKGYESTNLHFIGLNLSLCLPDRTKKTMTRSLPQFSLSILICFLVFSCSNVKEENRPWSLSFGGAEDDRGNKIALDPQGNVIITGRFTSKEIKVGEFVLKNSSRDSMSSDVFVIKCSPQGKVLWAKGFGGTGNELGLHIATDKKGNIAVIGEFESEVFQVGNYQFTNKTEKGKGGDCFLIKFSPDGEMIWAREWGGEKHDAGYDTCVFDDEGNLYYIGSFYSNEIRIDHLIFERTDIGCDTYVVKFNPDGKAIWGKSSNSDNDDSPQTSALDSQGNLIVCGYFRGRSFVLEADTLYSESGRTYIAKFSPDGKMMWMKNYKGNGAFNMCTTIEGQIMMGGFFCDSILSFGDFTLSNSGQCDLLIAQLNAEGKPIWAESPKGEGMEGIRGLCTDGYNNCIITGSLMGPSLSFGEHKITNIGNSENIFLASYSSDGKALWAMNAGGSGRNAGRHCVADKQGNVYLVGSYEEPNMSWQNDTLRNQGQADIFLAKIIPSKRP
jgi:hypothetical protein